MRGTAGSGAPECPRKRATRAAVGSASWEAVWGEVSPALWLPYINTMTFTTPYLESHSLLEGRMQIAWLFPAAVWEAIRAEHRGGLGSEGSRARGRLCRFSSSGEMRSLLLSPTA